MSVLKYRLATCSYSQFKPDMGLPIRASLGAPRWWTGDKKIPPTQVMLELAPHRSYFRSDYEHVFKPRFAEQCDRLGIDAMIDRFNEIGDTAGLNPGDTLVVLCFEKLRDWNDEDCHRALWRKWWLSVTGEQIPELGLPARAPDTPVADTLPMEW